MAAAARRARNRARARPTTTEEAVRSTSRSQINASAARSAGVTWRPARRDGDDLAQLSGPGRGRLGRVPNAERVPRWPAGQRRVCNSAGASRSRDNASAARSRPASRRAASRRPGSSAAGVVDDAHAHGDGRRRDPLRARARRARRRERARSLGAVRPGRGRVGWDLAVLDLTRHLRGRAEPDAEDCDVEDRAVHRRCRAPPGRRRRGSRGQGRRVGEGRCRCARRPSTRGG